ncbi:hypothetical protein OFO01_01155 [Campylobacter sp. JMF_01 NE2]|uniref:hypothetical protein n=1 Tax=unclassified Campylobacter TaxID=2593542 RepID=UPI0022E9A821|nr:MULTISPECIES: hypothetical protein [unclassified Campylobacter]MDA3052061.1 hypothetical protein [Campylobacter sp. JMF_03 NE3]MDA3066395.1 hypothetical protein [Campylobacter sp. JMF_01 NE2]
MRFLSVLFCVFSILLSADVSAIKSDIFLGKNIQNGLNELILLCENGQASACGAVGEIAASQGDKKFATSYLRKSCELGGNCLCYENFMAGNSVEDCEKEPEQDIEEAEAIKNELNELMLLCKGGIASACGALGEIAAKQGDTKFATQYLKKSCELGGNCSCYENLIAGNLVEDCTKEPTKNIEETVIVEQEQTIQEQIAQQPQTKANSQSAQVAQEKIEYTQTNAEKEPPSIMEGIKAIFYVTIFYIIYKKILRPIFSFFGRINSSFSSASQDDDIYDERKMEKMHKKQMKEIERKNKEMQEKNQREMERKNKEMEEKNQRELIGSAVQDGNYVYVYNLKGSMLFSRLGELVGYTSTTVSVLDKNSDGKYGTVYVYNNKGSTISSKPWRKN